MIQQGVLDQATEKTGEGTGAAVTIRPGTNANPDARVHLHEGSCSCHIWSLRRGLIVTGGWLTPSHCSAAAFVIFFWQGFFELLKRVSEGSLTVRHVEFGVSRAWIPAFVRDAPNSYFTTVWEMYHFSLPWRSSPVSLLLSHHEKSVMCDQPLAKPHILGSSRKSDQHYQRYYPCQTYESSTIQRSHALIMMIYLSY